MRRRRDRACSTLRSLAALVAVLATGPAVAFQSEDCRRVTLIDAASGAPVVGPEDITFDPARAVFWIAAFDRDQDGPDQDGRWSAGLYPLDPALLSLEGTEMTVTPVPIRDDGPFRPHGIAVDGSGLTAIDRVPARDPADRTRLARLDLSQGQPVAGDMLADASLCRANDVWRLKDGRTLVSLDRRACGGASLMAENVLGRARGGVALVDGATVRRVVDGLFFANGLVVVTEGGVDWLVVAETRGRRLAWFPLAEVLTANDPLTTPARTTALPAAPDNLNLTEGAVLVTALEDLFALFLHRLAPHWFDPPGSQVLRVGLDGAAPAVQRIGTIPGHRLAAATVAATGAGWLILGSALDDAILACPWTSGDRSG